MRWMECLGGPASHPVGAYPSPRSYTKPYGAVWIENYRQLWAAHFNELDTVVEELKRKEKANGFE